MQTKTSTTLKGGLIQGALQSLEINTTIDGHAFIARIGLWGPNWLGWKTIDWSLRPFQQSADAEKRINRDLAGRVYTALTGLGKGPYYAPVPTEFNGLVVEPRQCVAQIPLGTGIDLHRGARADGVKVPRGCGAIFSTAGCLLILASDGRRSIVAHGGFRSLFRHDEPGFTSVMKNVAHSFAGREKQVRSWIFFALRPELHAYPPDDRRFGEKNVQVIQSLRERGYGPAVNDRGHIDTRILAGMQAREYGISAPESTSLSYLDPSAYNTRLVGQERNHRNLSAVYICGIQ